MQENTFQCVLVTDGVTSYAIFNYECGGLQWAGISEGNYAISGYSLQGSIEIDRFSATPFITEIACRNSPCSESYSVLHEISGVASDTQVAAAECVRLASEDEQEFTLPPFSLLDCPCSYNQALFDNRYFM